MDEARKTEAKERLDALVERLRWAYTDVVVELTKHETGDFAADANSVIATMSVLTHNMLSDVLDTLADRKEAHDAEQH